MDPQEDLIDRDIPLTVLLPGGQEATATVHGSKPVMDVLVALCAQHHLVPSDHVIKLISTNQNHINFKPNSMIGSLEFERVVLQTKGSDANKKKPNIPVATVRLLINYKKSHKAVVRVNPTVPLIELMPTVCEKCEFNPDYTILLKTYQSEEPLDLTKTLNDYGVRELYAKEMKAVQTNLPVDPVSTPKGGEEEPKTPVKEKKGNKGFFGLFKKSKKTSEQAVTDSASTSPELNGQCADRVNGLNGHSTLPTVPADMPKKRPAPRPPATASQSVCGLHTRDFSDLPESDPAGKQGQLSRISSTESSLKRTKRRAPPPPCDGPAPSDSDNKEEAQGDNRRSDKYRAHITDRCPAITKVMSELVESLQARHQRTLSSANSSISQNQSAEDSSTGVFSEHHTPEAELKALPGCQLLRSPSEREGLTTFTVIPQRRQQSRQCFEAPLTLQTPDAAKAEEDPCPGDPDALETPTVELLEEVPLEIFINEGTGSDKSEHLSEIVHLQHLEKENQALMDIDSENLELKDEEDQCNTYPKNIELESWGLNNLEHFDSKINNLELRDSWSSLSKPANKLADTTPIDPTDLDEREEMEEHASVENEEEKDWEERYKERRRKFLNGDDGMKRFDVWGRIQREFTNVQEENTMQEMDFPSPPPPVRWDENSSKYKEDIENGSEQEIQSVMKTLSKGQTLI
ncbi:protein cordon-bleu isoform X2 [Megalobrama amblycephala]|uniref:protein cordon-bleu isoform X2 n=1 Tax=Megalobrama amblycephala TaxID=75352 RepID=UPI002013F1AA|nr:protein cordon-bleu isoform X2 [Megalobrama amblycephala]